MYIPHSNHINLFCLLILSLLLISLSSSQEQEQDEEGAAAESDPCNDNPCGERGVCRDLGNNFAYACQCDRGWTDDDNFQLPNCKKLDDSTCHDDMCEHGGRCPLNSRTANCECPKGYTGKFCERSRSATWIDNIKRPSFKLLTISVINFAPLQKSTTPHVPARTELNSEVFASKIALVSLFHLRTAGGICALNPCGNHGYCFELTPDSYTCECDPGWLQDALLRQPNCRITSSFECVNSNCENGGRCPFSKKSQSSMEKLESEGEVVPCVCPTGTSGNFCENLDHPSNQSINVASRSRNLKSPVLPLVVTSTVLVIIAALVIVFYLWRSETTKRQRVQTQNHQHKVKKLKKLSKRMSDTLLKLKKKQAEDKGDEAEDKSKKEGKANKEKGKEKKRKRLKKNRRGELLRHVGSTEDKLPSSDSPGDDEIQAA